MDSDAGAHYGKPRGGRGPPRASNGASHGAGLIEAGLWDCASPPSGTDRANSEPPALQGDCLKQ